MSNYNVSERFAEYTIHIDPSWGQGSESLTIYNKDIISLNFTRTCFMKSGSTGTNELPITLGQANAGEINLKVVAGIGEIVPKETVGVSVSTAGGGWSYMLGLYRIDKVEKDIIGGTVTIHGYDRMADLGNYTVYALQYYGYIGSSATDIQILNALTSLFTAVTIDSSVTDKIDQGYTISSSYYDTNLRDMVAQIAAAYGGAFFFDYNTLHFIDLIVPEETNLLLVKVATPLGFDQISELTIGGDHIIVKAY